MVSIDVTTYKALYTKPHKFKLAQANYALYTLQLYNITTKN
jgi:hypothetical protein